MSDLDQSAGHPAPEDDALPRLAHLYQLRRDLLRASLQFGPTAVVAEEDAAALGVSASVSFATLRSAVEQMIEAMSTLRDFSKEPLTEHEQAILDETWGLEHDEADFTPAGSRAEST